MANEKRLIDANALYAKLGKMAREPYYQHNGEDYFVGIANAAGEVAEAPTVDAKEVVHGRWENNPETETFNSAYVCSVCKNVYWHHRFGADKHCGRNRWNYCPHCGAKMDGGNEDGG